MKGHDNERLMLANRIIRTLRTERAALKRALDHEIEIGAKHANLAQQLAASEQQNRELLAREARAIRLLQAATSNLAFENVSSVLIAKLMLNSAQLEKLIDLIDGEDAEPGLLSRLRSAAK